MDHPFRGAAFGGFNRQDVLTYLENTAREAAQQREALEQQLEQQRQAAESALRQIEEQSQQILQLQQANQRLQGGEGRPLRSTGADQCGPVHQPYRAQPVKRPAGPARELTGPGSNQDRRLGTGCRSLRRPEGADPPA